MADRTTRRPIWMQRPDAVTQDAVIPAPRRQWKSGMRFRDGETRRTRAALRRGPASGAPQAARVGAPPRSPVATAAWHML